MRAPALIPPASVLRHLPTAGGCAVVRAGAATVIGVSPMVVRAASGADSFAVLREVDEGGFWIGACAYDLGRSIERVHERTAEALAIPDVAFARYDNRIVPLLHLPCDVNQLSWTLQGFQTVDFTRGFAAGCRELLRIWGLGYRSR